MMHRLLLALDGSDASKKEVEYVAGMASGRDDVHVHLAHVLPPGTLAEGEGANDEARAVLEQLRDRLCAAGVSAERVDIGALVGRPDSPVVDALLDLTRDQECDTIVVGRHSLPWYRDLFHHHAADELVKRGEGFAIWVVE